MTDPTTGAEQGDEGTIEGEVLSSDESPEAPDTPEESSRALAAVEDIIDIEKRRVGIQEERSKLASRTLEVTEESDRRQHEYHLKRLAAEERQEEKSHSLKEKSHSLTRLLVIGGGGGFLLFAALVLCMAFFGDETQSRIAMRIMEEFAKALSGAGALLVIMAIMRRLGR